MALQTLALFFLGTVAAGGIAWVFIYPILSGERQAEKRKELVAKPEQVTVTRVGAQQRGTQKARREQVEDTLKELEVRQKSAKRRPLSVRITQAGLKWSKRKFIMISAGLGLGAFLVGLGSGVGLVAALAIAFAGALGLPRWILSFLKNRRERRFLDVFPDAVDVIVRGIKAGLPLGDCMKIIANDAQEPVKSEFRAINQIQTIGMPIGEAVARLYESIP